MPPMSDKAMSKVAATKLPSIRLAKARRLSRG
jgi:hypothetical protein